MTIPFATEISMMLARVSLVSSRSGVSIYPLVIAAGIPEAALPASANEPPALSGRQCDCWSIGMMLYYLLVSMLHSSWFISKISRLEKGKANQDSSLETFRINQK